MTPYLFVLFLLLLSITIKGLKGRDLIAIVAYSVMVFLCGWRGRDVGVDTDNYWIGYISGSERMEPMFQVVSVCSHFFGMGIKLFLLTISLITFVPLFIYIKKHSTNISYSFLIFLTFSPYFYHETYNTIRVYMAIVFMLFAYDSMNERKFWLTFLYVLLASLSHYSAIIIILLALFIWFSHNLSFNFVCIAVFVSIMFGLYFATSFTDIAQQMSEVMVLANSDIGSYYSSHYLDRFSETSFNIVGTLANMLPFSFLTVVMYDEENGKSFLFKLFLIAVLLQNVFISVEFTYRITMFFLILIVVLLPNTFVRLSRLRKFCVLCLSSFMVLWYVYQLFTANEDSLAGTIPYHF